MVWSFLRSCGNHITHDERGSHVGANWSTGTFSTTSKDYIRVRWCSETIYSKHFPSKKREAEFLSVYTITCRYTSFTMYINSHLSCIVTLHITLNAHYIGWFVTGLMDEFTLGRQHHHKGDCMNTPGPRLSKWEQTQSYMYRSKNIFIWMLFIELCESI